MTSALAVDVNETKSEPTPVPVRIGRFEVREEIGRGSNGIVYSAIDPVLGRDVAIKAIPLDAQYPGHADMESGFLQEAKIAAGLNHPSIVTVFDAGKTDTLAYIAMERLKGSDLHHWLANNRCMPAEACAGLMARVADAVHFAHRRGLIHRDIKPSNIFLGRDMKPKVLDFGIALAQEKQHGRPDEPKKLIGTPNYMSPEQALARPLDARSDVFSIGTILYELVTGHRAFDGANIDDILTKVVKIDPPSVHSWRPDISPVMGEIIMRALAKEPANRYQTAAQLRNDLAAFAGRPVGPGTSPPESEAASAPRKFPTPGPAAMISTGVAVAGLTLTFALWFASSRNDADAPPSAAAPAVAAVPASRPAAGAPAPAATPAGQAQSDAEADAGGVGSAVSAASATANTSKSSRRAAPAAKPKTEVDAAAAAAAAAAAPAEPGILALAVLPWGQVSVDGKEAGVSPPLNHLELLPGAHTIEVRNGNLPVFTTEVQIEAGKTVPLQHRF